MKRFRKLFARSPKPEVPSYKLFTTKTIDGEIWAVRRSTGLPIRKLSSFFTDAHNESRIR